MSKLYNPKLVTFVVNGRHITDWKKLRGGRSQDKTHGFSTADGQSYAGIDSSQLGFFELTLPHVHPHHAFLVNLEALNEPFPIAAIDKSPGSPRSDRGSQCFVKKMADSERGKAEEETDETWEFVVLDWTSGYHGDITDDETPLPTTQG